MNGNKRNARTLQAKIEARSEERSAKLRNRPDDVRSLRMERENLLAKQMVSSESEMERRKARIAEIDKILQKVA